MSLYTVNPSTVLDVGFTLSPSGGSALTYLTDALDTTFISKTSTSQSASYRLRFPSTSPCPSSEFITGVRAVLRCAASYVPPAGYPIDATMTLNQTFGTDSAAVSVTNLNTSSVTPADKFSLYDRGRLAYWNAVDIRNGVSFDNGAWAGTTVEVSDYSNGPKLRSYKAYLEVATASIPKQPQIGFDSSTITDKRQTNFTVSNSDRITLTVSSWSSSTTTRTITTSSEHNLVVGQTFTVTQSGNDTFDDTYSVSTVVSSTQITATSATSLTTSGTNGFMFIGDNLAPATWRYKIFTSAQVAAAGFDPYTSVALYDSNQLLNTNGAQVVTYLSPTFTANGTYTFYAQITKTSSGVTVSSPMSNPTNLVVNVTSAVPTFNCTWDNTNQRITATYSGNSNILPTNISDPATGVVGVLSETNCTLSLNSLTFLGRNASWQTVAIAAGASSALTTRQYVAPSVAYSAIAQFRLISGTAPLAGIDIVWYTAANAVISSSTGTTATALSGSWLTATVTGTSPSNAAYGAVRLKLASAAISSTVVFDLLALHPGSTPTFSSGLPWGDNTKPIEVTWKADVVRTDSSGTSTTKSIFTGYGQAGSFLESEPIRNQNVTYVLTITGTDPTGASKFRSWAGRTVNITTTSDNQWWLKCREDNTLSRPCKVLSYSVDLAQQVGVFQPLSSNKQVVVSGQIYGESGTITIACTSPVEWIALQKLLNNKGVFVLQHPYVDENGYGIQKTVKITSRNYTVTNPVARPYYVATVGFTEVTA